VGIATAEFRALFRSTLLALRFLLDKYVTASFWFESRELKEIKQTLRLTAAIQNSGEQ
jgi:hypothetical protein